MERLLIFADIHGSFSAWMTAKHLLSFKDSLVMAGDLFDTGLSFFGYP